MSDKQEKGKPNPEVKDNGDGTKTLTYRETDEQRGTRETAERLKEPEESRIISAGTNSPVQL